VNKQEWYTKDGEECKESKQKLNQLEEYEVVKTNSIGMVLQLDMEQSLNPRPSAGA
jgi:hypothetical protein